MILLLVAVANYLVSWHLEGIFVSFSFGFSCSKAAGVILHSR